MTIEFIYMKELESFLQILVLGFVLSLPVCYAVESLKSSGIAKAWFYFAASIVISAGFGMGFAYAFTEMTIYEAIFLSACLWLGSQGFYEKLNVSDSWLGKSFISLSERFQDKSKEETVPEVEVPAAKEEEVIPEAEIKMPEPEERELTKAQLKVLVKDLRVRKEPGGEVLGYATKDGFYSFSGLLEANGITWFNVGGCYIGDSGDGDIKVFAVGQEDKEEYLIHPVNYVGISTDFSSKHPAIDYGFSSTKLGKNQPIIAPSDMEVVAVGEGEAIGKYVRAYATVNGEKLTYRFIHMSATSVSKGDKVKQGEQIGKMGDTGTECNGYHLHFDIWKGHTEDLSGSSQRYAKSINPLEVCYLVDGQTVGDETDVKYKILKK